MKTQSKYPSQSELEKIIEDINAKTDISGYVEKLPNQDKADEVIRYLIKLMLAGVDDGVNFRSLMESCHAYIHTDFPESYKREAIKRLQEAGWDINLNEAENIVINMDTSIGSKICDLSLEKNYWPRLEKIKELLKTLREHRKVDLYRKILNVLFPSNNFDDELLSWISEPKIFAGSYSSKEATKTFLPYGIRVVDAAVESYEIWVSGLELPSYQLDKPDICRIVLESYSEAISKAETRLKPNSKN